MDKVRVGFIGCGGNAKGHMRKVNEIDAAQIVAVCDVAEACAAEAGELTGGQTYTDMHKMLERDDLDAVYISIPVFAHGEPEKAVIERGLPFYVEKPVTRDMATALEIQALVEKHKIMTAVGYQLRYGAAASKARAFLQDKTVSLAVAKYWSGTGRATIGKWTSVMAQSGGQILEQATHTIDMMRYLVGDVVEVSCRAATRTLTEIDCPDTTVAQMTFASGALGVITACWDYDNRDWSNANILDIVAGQDRVAWSGSKLSITHDGETTDETLELPSADEVFVNAVRTGDGSAILSPYADGVKSLAISLAAIESAETGQPVKVN